MDEKETSQQMGERGAPGAQPEGAPPEAKQVAAPEGGGEGAVPRMGRDLYGRTRRLVKKHPAVWLALAAGVAVAFEAELAAAALVGIALTELVEHGREKEGFFGRSRRLVARGYHGMKEAIRAGSTEAPAQG